MLRLAQVGKAPATSEALARTYFDDLNDIEVRFFWFRLLPIPRAHHAIPHFFALRLQVFSRNKKADLTLEAYQKSLTDLAAFKASL